MKSVDNRQLGPTELIMRRRRYKTVTADVSPVPKAVALDEEDHALQLLREKSLSFVLGARIEAMIFAGELAPGQHVNELLLAERFGVSRAPLRQALGTLTAEGMLVQQKNRGTFVRQVDAKEASEIYELREIMELASVRALAGKSLANRAPVLSAFHVLLGQMCEAVTKVDALRYYELNLAFHELLIGASENAKMLSTYRGLARELVLFRRRYLRGASSLGASLAEHRRIVRALGRTDPSAALESVAAHIEKSRQRALGMKE